MGSDGILFVDSVESGVVGCGGLGETGRVPKRKEFSDEPTILRICSCSCDFMIYEVDAKVLTE